MRIDAAEAFAAANLVLLARHQPTEVDLDLSFGWTAFEHQALAASATTRFGEVTAPMARVDELLVFKAMAGRPRDVDDAVTLLTLYPHTDLTRVRRWVVELAALAEVPELTLGLEEIIDAARAPMRAMQINAQARSSRRVSSRQRVPKAGGNPRRTPSKTTSAKPVSKKPSRPVPSRTGAKSVPGARRPAKPGTKPK